LFVSSIKASHNETVFILRSTGVWGAVRSHPEAESFSLQQKYNTLIFWFILA